MKSIKFQELSFRNNRIWGVLLILALIIVLSSLFDYFSLIDAKAAKYLTSFAYLVPLLNFSRIFYFRNIVQWNKRGMTVRVNDFWGFNFSFSEVNRVFYAEDEYTLDLGGKRKTINLEGVDQESKEKLLTILRRHTEGRRS